MGFAHDVPVRQSVLPRSRTSTSWSSASRSRTTSRSCRGTHTFKAGGEWLHTQQRAGVPRLLRRAATSSTASPVSCATPRRPRRADSARTRVGCSNGTLRHRAGDVPGGHDGHRRTAAVLSAEQQPRRHRPRRSRRVGHHQRRVRAVRPGQVAAGPRPDARLRPALGRAVDARDGRSDDDRVRAVPERPALPVGRHDSESDGSSSSRASASRGTSTRDGKSVVRAQRRHLLRAAEHAEPGRLGDDQRHPAEERLPRLDVHRLRRHAGVAEPAGAERRRRPGRSRCSPASACSIATTRTRASTASTSASSSELAPSVAAYVDFTDRQGRRTSRAS